MKFFKSSKSRGFFFSWMGVSLFLILIRYLGLLLPLETFLYDYLFYLKDSEPVDKRIVIVGWNEDDVRQYSEGFISDRNLVKVLKTIKKQQPSVIGLDIFRDVPVPSFYLSKQENQQAYRELNQIFSSTQNLVGITKVIPPFIDYPQSLAEENRITSADLPVDEDNFIRRAYLFPQPEEKSELFDILSLSFYTTLQYLTDKGFSLKNAEEDSSTMLFYNEESNSQRILNPLERFDGSYIIGDAGIQFIVNWRKNKAPFLQVSVTEVIEGSIPPDIFENKIVLIGNTSVSTADRHYTPLNRFSRSNLDTYTNGVAVHAHITSSIISAVLDGRPFIKTIPEWSEILLLLLSVGSVILVAAKYSQNSLKLLFVSSAAGLIITIVLLSTSYIGFTEGYWIPVLPSIIGSIVSPSLVCLIIYIDKIKTYIYSIEQNNQKLKQREEDILLFNKNFYHSLKNDIGTILNNADNAISLSSNFAKVEDMDEAIDLLFAYEKKTSRPPFKAIANNAKEIKYFMLKLNEQSKKMSENFRLNYLSNELFLQQPVIFNIFVKNTVTSILLFKSKKYKIKATLSEDYDTTIDRVSLHEESFIGVLDNLLDNAFQAIHAKSPVSQDRGFISIKTEKKENKVVLCVADNGIGINKEFLKKIFQPYYSFRKDGTGQGLGLFLVSEFVKRHNGQINVESTVGEGTTFILSLPQ